MSGKFAAESSRRNAVDRTADGEDVAPSRAVRHAAIYGAAHVNARAGKGTVRLRDTGRLAHVRLEAINKRLTILIYGKT